MIVKANGRACLSWGREKAYYLKDLKGGVRGRREQIQPARRLPKRKNMNTDI